MPDQPLSIVKEEPLTIVSEEPEKAVSQDNSMLGAVGRGLSSFWEQVNPLTAITGAASAIRHPIDTAENIGAAHKALYDKAAEAFKKGDYESGAVHGLNMLIPLLGPQIDALAERGAAGDYAGMIGGAAGLGTALAGPKAAVAGVKAVAKAPALLPTAVADVADAAAVKRMADVMAPKGLSKANIRLGNIAEKVAPQVAREPGMMAISRQGLAAKVSQKLAEAGDELDAAGQARPNTPIPTAPVVADLMKQRARYATSAGDVPDPFVGRVAEIDKAIKEVQALGPQATYDDLKVIRQGYDERGKAIYNAATPEYDKAIGSKKGAADVAASIRQRLAAADPNTANANAGYSLWKNANDVLDATEEIERTKAKVGRGMLAKTMGGMTGGELGGVKGAVIGYFVGPMLDEMASSGFTAKIGTARALAALADAIRSGQPAAINGAIYRVASVTGKTAKVKALLAGQTLGPTALPAAASDQTTTP